MGTQAGDVCPCDQSCAISDDKLRQLLPKLFAKLEKAEPLASPHAPAPPQSTVILLGTSYGVLLWGMLSNILVLWLVKVSCKLNDVFGFTRALCKIKLFKYMNDMLDGESANDPADRCRLATDVSAGLRDANSESSIKEDNERKEKEMRWRELLSQAISDELEKQQKGPKHEGNLVANGAVPSRQPAPEENVDVKVSTSTVLSDDEKSSLCKQVTDDLKLQEITVVKGSTILSGTVCINPSATGSLLNRAIDLVKKLCSSFDPAGTVQLGDAALLYRTSDENVQVLLLEQGVNDVPIITSVQRFCTKTIMIRGFYLKGTELKASMGSEKSVCLNVLFYQKLDNGREVVFAELPQDEVLGDKDLIYANKSIVIEGCENPLVLRSKAKQIDIHKHQSSTWWTFPKWIALSLLCVYQVLIVKPWHMACTEWALQLTILIINVFLVEYILGPWTFYIITRSLEFIMRSTNLDNILVLKVISMKNTRDIKSSYRFMPSRTFSQRNMVISTNTRELGVDSSCSSDNENTYTVSTVVNNKESASVTDENWEWPCFQRFRNEKGKWVKEQVNVPKNESFDVAKRPFEVVTTLDKKGKQIKVELIVHSTLLIQVLKQSCEPDKSGTVFRVGCGIDSKEIFHQREALAAYIVEKSSDELNIAAGDSSIVQLTVWHVKHVLRFVERQFAEELARYEHMQAQGCVSFDMLWTFFIPGDEVCRRCLVTDQECFATVNHPAQYHTDHRTGLDYCVIKLNVMDFNVKSYYKCTMHYKLDFFEGEVPLTSLQVCPLRFFPNRNDLEARFILNGNCFYEAAMQQPFRFMQFKGSLNFYAFKDGCRKLCKLNADGRVMIDLLNFARMNPDYYELRNAQPPCEIMAGMSKPPEIKKPSDEELKMAPAFAYGFSFRAKKWGCFDVCGLQAVIFNQGAFQGLRMRSDSQKEILWSVVQQYMAGSRMQNDLNQSIDLIGSKGTGCIVLCHGPPGTGKTLTAEALAETLRCALWSISAFELGDEPDKVEATLGNILEIAHTWHAILLIDEADVYLERRDEGVDVKRNLLTGVFLRVLEYYRGIMFLTTNRVNTFDDAILSRTTLAIYYPALDDTQRCVIWKNLLDRIGIHNCTYDALLQGDLNGRQIRNIVHLAQLLAHSRNQALSITHVLDAMDASTTGTNELRMPQLAS